MAATSLSLLALLLLLARQGWCQETRVEALVEAALRFYLPTKSSDASCAAQSQQIINAALYKDSWALRMMDASAKAPSGLQRGNVFELGNYDECMSPKPLPWERDAPFPEQFCVADVTFTIANQSILKPLVIDPMLRWGYCLPASCSSTDLAEQLQRSMDFLLAGSGDSAVVTIKPSNCRDTYRNQLDAGDWVTVGVLCAWLGVMIVATWIDYNMQHGGQQDEDKTKKPNTKSKGMQCLLAFSMYTNMKNLTSVRVNKGVMMSVNGLRFGSMLWVIVGHRVFREHERPMVNHHVVMDGLWYDWNQFVVTNGYLAVDTFFVLGGFLLAYMFLKGMDATKKFNVFMFYFYRYIRLTPPLILVIVLYARILDHVGTGPMWNEVVGKQERNCRERWWSNILYINNYIKPSSEYQCVSQTWYLCVDMQIFWFSPLILYPVWRWPKTGYALLGGATVAGVVAPFVKTYVDELPWTALWNIGGLELDRYFTTLYMVTYYRLAPYLVGMALGVLMYKIRNTKLDIKPHWIALGWFLCTLIGTSILWCLMIPYSVGYEYDALGAAFYGSFHRLGWGLVIAWIIFACEKGYGGIINTVLSWKYWQPLSRLSYCAYLVHIMVLIQEFAQGQTAEFYTLYHVVRITAGDLLVIFLVAAGVSLASELPVLTIEKVLLKGGGGKRPKKSAEMPPSGEIVEWKPAEKKDIEEKSS